MKLNWKVIIPLAVWAVLVLYEVIFGAPTGLTRSAWWYFALFAAVILGLILEPIPAAAIGLIGVTVAAAMRYVNASSSTSITWALSGFQDTTVWLIFGAFVFSMGYNKTGLGRRIALLLVKWLGGRTLGLGYAITLSDLVLSPGTPSNTARSGGTIFPVIRNIPALYGSEPNTPSARKIGAYIMWTAIAATCVTSSMFITSLAPTAAALAIVKTTTKVDVNWLQYAIGFLPVGIVLLVLVPLLVYMIYPPEIKASKEIPQWAAGELAKMGSISRGEIIMIVLVVLAIFLWITGSNALIELPYFGTNFINATTVVLVGIVLMLVTGVVTWEDILANKSAWNVLVWFATLVTLASGLSTVGFVGWFAKLASAPMKGMDPIMVIVLLVLLFFFIHYFFASLTAHTNAVLPLVLGVGVALLPANLVLPFALLCVYSLGLMGIISPYATGPSPIYYGSGYITRTDYWKLGLIFGIVFVAALLIIGIPYLTSVKL
jgi:citrate:succinate antiporter/L-tartrate/succinate antiporter